MLAVGTLALATRDWRPPEEPGAAPERRAAAGAWSLCKRVVTERLGPASAVQYPWFDERAVERLSDSVFVVRASVHASSTESGPVQVAVVCRARWLGADRWLDAGTTMQGPMR